MLGHYLSPLAMNFACRFMRLLQQRMMEGIQSLLDKKQLTESFVLRGVLLQNDRAGSIWPVLSSLAIPL